MTAQQALRFVVKHGGDVKVDLPIKELGDEAPLYDRPHVPTPRKNGIDPASVKPPLSNRDALIKLIGVVFAIAIAVGFCSLPLLIPSYTPPAVSH